MTVRILYGRYDHARPGFVMETVGDFERFVADVASEVPRGSPVRLYGCFMKTWRHLPTPSWNHSKIVAAYAAVLTDPGRSVDVSVVLSEVGAEAAIGGTYSFGTTFDEIVAKMREATAGRAVTGRMQLAPIRCSAAGDCWRYSERELKFTNHAKVWIVDDRLLHVGSDNI